jgi:DNA-binding winged helix-turn-helix (wHTH) protein
MRTDASQGGEQIPLYRFGEFTFDCGSHLLLRAGVEQHLSPKAKQLLRLLLVNRPRAISREELYDQLWPSTFVCETNLATVISEVRRALGDGGRASQFIRTVHGFGYAFAGEVSTVAPQRLPVAMLLCEHQRYLLYDGENSVGRAQDCRVVLTGATVSRHHANIIIAHRDVTIEDLDSRNGTYVKGRKITRSVVRYEEAIAFGAVQATIVRKISSTMPLPLPLDAHGTRRRSSSGSIPLV